MAKAQPKLVLAPAQGIPFDQLVLSQSNVRRVKNGVTIEDLARDIERRGLLNGLSVRPELDDAGAPTGKFAVPAGGRRFRALAILVKRKRLARDAIVPCVVKLADDAVSAEEDSYAENVLREPLHPLDEFRGMKQLVDQGGAIEDVAARFHVTPAVVRQRLKLACVSPALHDIYAADGMSLEQLMAFTVCDDHARQQQVWELVQSHHNQSAWFIRARLNEITIPARDPRALFVGIEAYVAAGGCVLRDLFEEDRGGWLQDAALLDRMVEEKLGAEAERLRGEGWKWVEAAIDLPYGVTQGMRPIEAIHTPAGEADLAQVAARITAIDERIAELAGGSWIYDPAEMARAGVFVTIDRCGGIEIDAGWVRPEDEPAVEPEPGADTEVRREDDAGASEAPGEAGADPIPELAEDEEDGLKPLPDRLVCELTAARTLALQDAVVGNPKVAFAAVLHNFVLTTFYHGRSETCLDIHLSRVCFGAQPAGMNHSPAAAAIETRQAAWKERLPRSDRDLWDALQGLDGDEQAALFAHCAAYAVNALYEVAPRYDNGRVSAHGVERRLAQSHVLARAVGLDLVAAGWKPTADMAARIDHLKKPDMAREAENLMEDAGWLPEPLRTPDLPAQAELIAVAPEAPVPADGAADAEEGPLAIAAE